MENKKLLLIENTKQFFEEHGRFPTTKEVETLFNVPGRTMRRYFNGIKGLIEATLETIDEPLFTKQRAEEVKNVINESKRFVITTAVVGAEVNQVALLSLKNFCKKNKATLLVIPAADPAANVSDGLAEELQDELIVFENTNLNDNIAIFALKLSAKQINPTTGLGRFGQRNKSFIFASPKQSLEFVSVGNNRLPHALMTTGAITKPAYQTTKYMSQRTAFIAEHDHVEGAIIVEVVDDKIYHFRQIQFHEDGSFIDLGKKYKPNSVSDAKILSMVLGDWHAGATDTSVAVTTYKMIEEFKPQEIVLHDLFNGMSISHHVDHLSVTKAKLKLPSLVEELRITKQDLNTFSSMVKKVVVVKSNHDEWIDRYLEEGRYLQDPRNFRKALDLAAAKYDGKDCLSYGLYQDKIPGNIKFLKRDEDHIIKGIQLGCHSDLEGSLIRLEKSFGKAIGGHSHTAAILRGVRKVGTSTSLREDYAKGPISWTHTHALVNEDGSVQLINIIDGEYKLLYRN